MADKRGSLTLLYRPPGMSKRSAPFLVSRAVFQCACAAARSHEKVGFLSLARPRGWLTRRLKVLDAETKRHLFTRESLPSTRAFRKWLRDSELSRLWIDDLSAVALGEAEALELIRRAVRGLALETYYQEGRLYAEILAKGGKVDGAAPAEGPKIEDSEEEKLRDRYGRAFAEMRRRSGYTLDEVSSRAGIASATIKGWESGRSSPRFYRLIRYLEALGGDLGTLSEIAKSSGEPEGEPR